MLVNNSKTITEKHSAFAILLLTTIDLVASLKSYNEIKRR
jgi:hypothetical protein